MGNLLLRSFNIREKIVRQDPVYGEMEGYVFPGRYINYKWDGDNMKITNFEQANQFVKREYREGWGNRHGAWPEEPASGLGSSYLYNGTPICQVQQFRCNQWRNN